MNELFLNFCTYMSFQGSGYNGCRTAITQSYNQSELKPIADQEQHYWEHYGTTVYESLPMNKPLGAIVFVSYDLYKKECKLSLSNHIEMQYSNNTYNLNLKWSF